MEEKARAITNAAIGEGGLALAVAPKLSSHFYETPEWLGLVALMGMGILVLSLLNAGFTFRRNWRHKDDE